MGQIFVNGVSYSGKSITIKNNQVIIDGKNVDPQDSKVITIVVEGDITHLNADRCDSISVTGSTGSISTMSGDVTVGGEVHGNVKTMSGDVDCGDIGGEVSTMSGDIKRK